MQCQQCRCWGWRGCGGREWHQMGVHSNTPNLLPPHSRIPNQNATTTFGTLTQRDKSAAGAGRSRRW
eukprot:162237-Chlamydomonas_euryale.AAC.2